MNLWRYCHFTIYIEFIGRMWYKICDILSSLLLNSSCDKSLRFLVIIMKIDYRKKRSRNSTQASVEIDYDKLANAIVKANRMADKEELQPEQKGKTKIKFFKGLWRLIKGDVDTEEEMTLGLFSLILSGFFFVIAIIGFIFALFVIGSLIVKMEWAFSQILSNIVFIGVTVLSSFIVCFISVIALCAGREVEKSKDKNFIFNAFSGVVGLIALVVALIALKK